MSLMISFFMGFRVGNSYDKVGSDKIIISNLVCRRFGILGVLSIFLIIKYVCFEPIIFVINLNITLSYKDFNIFNSIYLFDCIIILNK